MCWDCKWLPASPKANFFTVGVLNVRGSIFNAAFQAKVEMLAY